jgi:15-cis-phytoene synthase
MATLLTPQQIEDAARAMPDHTLATSFLEPEPRARVIALILFAHEIARARAVVSEPGLAAIRLQWWRDTLDQIYSGKIVRAEPTSIALKSVIVEADLPRALFEAMISGHERELDSAPFGSWTELEAYLDATLGNLNRLSLLACGISSLSRSMDDAARHAGVAWGLASLLGALPNWARRRCVWLPTAEMADSDREALFLGQVNLGVHNALLLTCDRITLARTRLNQSLKTAKLGTHFPILAPACLARRYAKVSMPAIGETRAKAGDVSLLMRQIRLTLAVAVGRV